MATQVKTEVKNKTMANSFDSKMKESEKTLATGGGEPIEKGHKRTTEKRVLQPRDPETGQFDYNSSAGIERKYDYHAERNGHVYKDKNGKVIQKGGGRDKKTVPWTFRDMADLWDNVNKGDTILTEDNKRVLASCDFSKDDFIDAIETISGLNKFSQAFVDKKGRYSKAEKEALETNKAIRDDEAKRREKGDFSSGENLLMKKTLTTGNKSKLGKTTKERLKQAARDYARGVSSEALPEEFASLAANLDPQTLAANQAFNAWFDNQGRKVMEKVMSKHDKSTNITIEELASGLDELLGLGRIEQQPGKDKSTPSDKVKNNIAQALMIKLQKATGKK